MVLVDGPFSNLSGGVSVLTDFIARVRALRLIQQRKISPKSALALVRDSLVQCFGLMSSLLWARHIIVRFRDAVVRTPRRQAAADQDILSDIYLIRGVGRISVQRKCSSRAHLLLFTAAKRIFKKLQLI